MSASATRIATRAGRAAAAHPESKATCLAGNCRTDSDCANGGYCSPTLGQCGNYTGVIGYYCHTPSDECTDDSDCTGNPTSGPGYCMYSPEVAHWLCSYSHCVG